MTRLEVAIRYARGPFRLEARFALGNEALVIVGPSGGGKSTLLRILAGLDVPDRCGTLEAGSGGGAGSGARTTLRWDGEDLSLVPVRDRRFGWVAQAPALFLFADVEENVRFGTKRLPRKEREDAVREAIAVCDLERLAHRRTGELSGGERQRVAFARAVASRPRALLLDEPFSALEPASRVVLWDFLRDLRARTGLPFVHVTHDPVEALELADSIALLHEGRLHEPVGRDAFLAEPGIAPALLAHLLPDGGARASAFARLREAAASQAGRALQTSG